MRRNIFSLVNGLVRAFLNDSRERRELPLQSAIVDGRLELLFLTVKRGGTVLIAPSDQSFFGLGAFLRVLLFTFLAELKQPDKKYHENP